ncbi:MAG: sortase [Clostridium sp.]|nr:sortase [Clostridium sp.]
MSEERTNTNEAQVPPQGQVPPMPFGYPYPMPPMGQVPGAAPPMMPYPMFVPVPVYMPYGSFPTALPPQGNADPMQLNSYERQAGMQVVYQDGQDQAPGGFGYGGYPYPQMMMPPYGYYGQPPFPGYGQQQAPAANAYEADVQVLYQAVDEDNAPAEQEHEITATTPEQAAVEEPAVKHSSLADLFEEAEITASAAKEDYFDEDDFADLFDEPGQKRSFKQQLRDLFPKRSDSTGEKVRKSAFITSIVAILVAAPILLNSFFIGPTLERRELDEIKQIVYNSSDIPDGQLADQFPGVVFPSGFNKKYAAVYAKNQDLRGWLSIPSLNIDYPVLQTTDNEYYLKHAFDKSKNKHGVPFFDANTRITATALSKNLVIYGHNNAYVDLVFHNLINYREIKQWQQTPTIEMNTIYGNEPKYWQIYAVFYTNGVQHSAGEYIFPYHWTEMRNEANFLGYIAEVDRRALYKTGVDIQPSDTLLTLSTCAFNFDGSRFVVVARLVRPGEEPYPDVSKVVKNDNPQYPDYYYEKKNLVNPYANVPDWQYSADM